MTDDTQEPNEIAEALLEKVDDDDVVLSLDDDTELPVSIRRPLYLPSSVDDDVAGGSLRYSVLASEDAVEALDLPGREGLIAAEEVESGTWNRSRIEFRDVETETDEDGDEQVDFGDIEMSREIRAVDA